jgi:hypothetical protein
MFNLSFKVIQGYYSLYNMMTLFVIVHIRNEWNNHKDLIDYMM